MFRFCIETIEDESLYMILNQVPILLSFAFNTANTRMYTHPHISRVWCITMNCAVVCVGTPHCTMRQHCVACGGGKGGGGCGGERV